MNNYSFGNTMPERPIPSSYIGLTKEKAIELTRRDGWIMHIESEDGIHYPMSSSLCYDRFSSIVKNNIVVWSGVIG
jgi:hypothetical protein